MSEAPFWKTKDLRQMTSAEWEALCDGCGICCLEKLEDEKDGHISITSAACEYLDVTNCRCRIYAIRRIANPQCIRITPKNVQRIEWLPHTCAYRTLAEGRELEWWHPLISGDPGSVHAAGISVRDKAVSAEFVHPAETLRGRTLNSANSPTKGEKQSKSNV
jgi:uncharacterized cysteine cluster protein YcgN (CxxCxxCC family)